MNKEMKKVPTVRFKGFADDWEQHKFGDIFKEYSDKGHEELPALTIIQGHGTIPRDEADRNMIFDKNSLNNYKLVNKSDFIVHLRSFEGGLEVANSQGIVSPAYHVFHGEKADTKFYYPYFRSFNFINAKLKPFVYGIRDGRSIDIQGMKKALIPYPSCDEQKKVGKLLTQIDDVFKLHQRKLEQLQTLKKYFLQNMFPAKGEKVPAIRFKGFTGDWKEQKFGDLCSVIDTKHATAPITDKQTIFRMIRTDCVRNGQLIVEKTDSVKEEIYEKWSERIYLQPGDLVFTREAPMGECAIIPDDGNKYFPGQRIVTLRAKGKTATIFINYLVYADEFRKEIRMRDSASTTVANFGISAIKEYTTLFPQPEEQLAIGKYFAYLDNLITLHQRKCDQLQSLKKFMLQNLFI